MPIEVSVTPALLALLAEFRIGLSFRRLNRLRIGERLVLDPGCQVEKYANFVAGTAIPYRLGAFSYANSALSHEWSIGRYCSIGRGVTVMGPEHPVDRVSSSPFTYSLGLPSLTAYFEDTNQAPYRPRRFAGKLATVSLGHDVWVGNEVLFARGVRVGDGAIVAARAVVTRDVPPFSIVGGIPARVIRMRFPDETLEKIAGSSWWQYGPDVIVKADPTKPDAFADRLVALNPQPLDLPRLTGEDIQRVSQLQ